MSNLRKLHLRAQVELHASNHFLLLAFLVISVLRTAWEGNKKAAIGAPVALVLCHQLGLSLATAGTWNMSAGIHTVYLVGSGPKLVFTIRWRPRGQVARLPGSGGLSNSERPVARWTGQAFIGHNWAPQGSPCCPAKSERQAGLRRVGEASWTEPGDLVLGGGRKKPAPAKTTPSQQI